MNRARRRRLVKWGWVAAGLGWFGVVAGWALLSRGAHGQGLGGPVTLDLSRGLIVYENGFDADGLSTHAARHYAVRQAAQRPGRAAYVAADLSHVTGAPAEAPGDFDALLAAHVAAGGSVGPAELAELLTWFGAGRETARGGVE